VTKSIRLLGKITQNEGFVPSSKNKLREECERPPKIDIKTYGIYALFETLLTEEIASLQTVFGKDNADKLLSFAMMRWAYQTPIKRLAYYHSHDFCSEFWSKECLLSDKIIATLLRNIGENRELVLQWMRSLLPENAANTENFVLMDSTCIMSAAEGLAVNAPGYNPSFDFGKQIRLMYMFSQNLKKPIYYRLINGNIPDISSIVQCINEANAQNITLVADKGFYSNGNLEALEKKGIPYIIPLHRNNSLIDYTPLLQADFKRQNQHFFYQKRVIWYYIYTIDGRKYVTFLDEKLRLEEEQDYLQRLNEKQEGYSEEEYFAKLHKFGTLTIACNSEKEQSAEQLYGIYKQRNEIEVMFDSYKNFLAADKTYMQNRYVLEGWLFVNFIAMLAYYKLFDKLRSAELLAKISPKDVIEFSKSICQMRVRGTWYRSEITSKTKKIFKKIGIGILT
jgi:transposase